MIFPGATEVVEVDAATAEFPELETGPGQPPVGAGMMSPLCKPWPFNELRSTVINTYGFVAELVA